MTVYALLPYQGCAAHRDKKSIVDLLTQTYARWSRGDVLRKVTIIESEDDLPGGYKGSAAAARRNVEEGNFGPDGLYWLKWEFPKRTLDDKIGAA